MQTAKDYFIRVKRYCIFMFEYLFLEKTRGLDFTMRDLSGYEQSSGSIHGYSKTNERHLREIFNKLSLKDCKKIMDIGCGKGVVLKEACKYPFQKITGIDIMPELVKTAKHNFKILRLDEKIECKQANAVEFEEYGKYDTFFLFNPFGREMLQQVVRKLVQNNENEHITIIYHNPMFMDVFTWFPKFQIQEKLHDDLKDYDTYIFQIK